MKCMFYVYLSADITTTFNRFYLYTIRSDRESCRVTHITLYKKLYKILAALSDLCNTTGSESVDTGQQVARPSRVKGTALPWQFQ